MRIPAMAFATVLLSLVAGCVSREGEDADGANQAIVGGKHEEGTLGAGYLVRDGKPSCSASLIAPDLVLTAAHCVDGGQDVSFGWGEVSAGTTMHASLRAIHPRYVEPPTNGGVAWQGFDVALLALDAPVTAAGVTPLDLGPTPSSGKVLAIGYGATSYEPGDGGAMEPRGVGTERKSTPGLVVSQNPVELFVRFEAGSSTCYGDSGSPLLVDGKVVGVLSRFVGTTRCRPEDRTMMSYTRVDVMDGFFADAKECMRSAPTSGARDARDQAVATCLRDDDRHLCATPRFSNRGTPRPITLSTGDASDGSSSFDLGDGEERTVRLVPKAKIKLLLFSQGDARMNVKTGASTIATNASEVTLEPDVAADIAVRSCTGERQSLTLVWHPGP